MSPFCSYCCIPPPQYYMDWKTCGVWWHLTKPNPHEAKPNPAEPSVFNSTSVNTSFTVSVLLFFFHGYMVFYVCNYYKIHLTNNERVHFLTKYGDLPTTGGGLTNNGRVTHQQQAVDSSTMDGSSTNNGRVTHQHDSGHLPTMGACPVLKTKHVLVWSTHLEVSQLDGTKTNNHYYASSRCLANNNVLQVRSFNMNTPSIGALYNFHYTPLNPGYSGFFCH